MAVADCVKQIQEAFPEISGQRLRKLVTRLEMIRKKYANDPQKRSFAEKKLWDDTETSETIRKAIAADQALKDHGILTSIASATEKGVEEIEGVRAIFVGTAKGIRGARDSIASRNKALGIQGAEIMMALKDKKKLHEYFDPKYDAQVARAMADPEVKGISPEVLEVAKTYQKVNNWVVRTLKAAGVPVGEIDGYITRQTHNPDKLIHATFEEWKNKIKPLVANEKSFGEALGNDRAMDAMLRDSYDKIVKSGSSHGSSRFMKSRSFHFNSTEDFIAYNAEFGHFDNLHDSLQEVIRTAARHAAITSRLGNNWTASVDMMKRLAPKGQEGVFGNKIDDMFQTVKGYDERVGHSRSAKITKGLRQAANLKLGAVIHTALGGDFVAAVFNTKGFSGEGVTSASIKYIGEYLNAFSPEVRKQVAKTHLLDMEQNQSAFLARITGDEPWGNGFWAKANRVWFTANLLGPHTRIAKVAVANKMGKSFKKVVNSKKLTTTQKNELKGFNISDQDLQNLRKITDDQISVGGVESLDPNSLSVPEGVSVAKYQHELGLKVAVAINDLVERAVPTPGKAESFTLGRFKDPDSLAGQGTRLGAQFKMTPLKMFRDTMYTSRMSGGNKADMAKHIGARLIMGTVAFMTMDSLGKFIAGEWDGDPENHPGYSAQEIADLMARSGGLGIAGDYIMGKKDLFFRNPLNSAVGPVPADMVRLGVQLHQAAFSEDATEKTMKTFMNFMIQQTPNYLGLPFIYDMKKSMMETSNMYIEDVTR